MRRMPEHPVSMQRWSSRPSEVRYKTYQMAASAGAEGPHRHVRSESKAGKASRRKRIQRVVVDISWRSRGLIAVHRRRRKALERPVSEQSRRGLDLTNFFMADVQMSFGAFLAFYLANLDWSKEDVGLALTAGGLAGVAAQIPGGALADAVHWKRGLATLGVITIAASAVMLALWPSRPLVFAAEILHGVTGGIVGPAIAAISLGLAGRRGMSSRVGRNFRFAAAGNALTAAAMGVLAVYLSSHAIFIAAALLCIPTLIALSWIRPDEIDYARARNAAVHDHSLDVQRVVDLTRNRNLLVFAGCMLLFQFSNASLLPIISQNLGHSSDMLSGFYVAGLVIVPQLVVAILAPWIGYWSELWGRKPLLLIGFAVEAMRALLFALVADPRLMIVVQLLDGITGAIVTVMTLLVITDLTSGTGRFNFAQGVIGTLTGISAAVSTSVLGWIALRFGDVPALLMMAAGTTTATALVWTFLPETKPAEYGD
jgi:MFS family permease